MPFSRFLKMLEYKVTSPLVAPSSFISLVMNRDEDYFP
jgi:hypothetical protein